jgi:hypothetical protein
LHGQQALFLSTAGGYARIVTPRFALALAVVCLLLAGGPALAATAPAVADGPAGSDTTAVTSSTPAPLASPATADAPAGLDPVARQSTSLSGLQGPPDTDATVTRVRALPNGTAVWTLTIRMQLDSEAAEEEFAAFEAEFENNRSMFVDDYRARMTGVVANADNATEREMTATGFDAETGTESVTRQFGFVTYRFLWEGFASVENSTVSVGDVFGSGFFLEETGLFILESPDGYEPTGIDPEPDAADDGELRWEGPVSFDDERPTAQFVPADSSTDDGSDDSTDDSSDGSPDDSSGDSTDGAPDDSPDDSTDDGSGGGGLSTGSVLFGTAGIAVLVGVAALYFHRRREEPDANEADAGAAAATTADDDPAQDSADAAETTDSEAMPDLATDEDRVVAALEAEDGRMRQSDLADELDWSPSKTSRVLSNMADEGQVEKLRIGRENVIDLVDDE